MSILPDPLSRTATLALFSLLAGCAETPPSVVIVGATVFDGQQLLPGPQFEPELFARERAAASEDRLLPSVQSQGVNSW